MKFNKRIALLGLPLLTLGLSACLGTSDSGTPLNKAPTSSIVGTVPGTLILAYGDNGAYYQVASLDDGSALHPFDIELPAGMGYRLVMVTNEGAPQAEWIYTPIAFRDATGALQTRLMFEAGQEFDIGHVALETSYANANCPGVGECVVATYVLGEDGGTSVNPLTLTDSDGDGTKDFDDADHGGYQYGAGTRDPMDSDGDGVVNALDTDDDNDGLTDDVDSDDNGDGIDDATQGPDSDHDGLPDAVDVNPHNDEDDDNRYGNDEDRDHDGYLDGDDDHDGYDDADHDHDGETEDEVEVEGPEQEGPEMEGTPGGATV